MNNRPVLAFIPTNIAFLLSYILMGFLAPVVFPFVENPMLVANIQGVSHPLYVGKISAFLIFWIFCFWNLTLVLELFSLRAALILLMLSDVAWIFLGALFNFLSYWLKPQILSVTLPTSSSFLGNLGFLDFQIHTLNMAIAIFILGIIRLLLKSRLDFVRLICGIGISSWLISFPSITHPTSLNSFLQALALQILLIPFWYTAEALLRIIGGKSLRRIKPASKPEKQKIFGPRELPAPASEEPSS